MTQKRKIYPNPKLILASRSPRRRSLLQQMGIVFEVSGADINEDSLPHEDPAHYTRRMAREKALAVGRTSGDAWILGADTVVVAAERIMGIPAGRDEAADMLSTLSGRSHTVITSFCLHRPSTADSEVQSVESQVIFKQLSPREIEGYIRSGEPFDKAGGYAVQGLGAFMVREVRGSYTNVVGLPLCEVIETMKRLDILGEFP